MAINTLAYATIFQTELDKQAEHLSLTNWMDANAGLVQYNGGNTVKVPKISMDGLGDYDRDDGYPQGSVTLEYETLTLTQDRGKKFQLDSQDVDETNFVANAGNVMGEFQRTKVIPEVDAYRLSAIATSAIEADEHCTYGYTPAKDTIADAFIDGLNAVRDEGFESFVIHATYATLGALQKSVLKDNISVQNFTVGGIQLAIPSIDGNPIIATPKNRMYSAISIGANGYSKGASAIDTNFLIIPRTAPIGVNKANKPKIITPEANQNADAWLVAYRRYHDLWVLENQMLGIYANFKDAKPVASGGSN